MDNKKEEVLKLLAEIKDLRRKEDELYDKAQEILGVEENSELDYFFFDVMFNDTDFDGFWEKYLNSEF